MLNSIMKPIIGTGSNAGGGGTGGGNNDSPFKLAAMEIHHGDGLIKKVTAFHDPSHASISCDQVLGSHGKVSTYSEDVTSEVKK